MTANECFFEIGLENGFDMEMAMHLLRFGTHEISEWYTWGCDWYYAINDEKMENFYEESLKYSPDSPIGYM